MSELKQRILGDMKTAMRNREAITLESIRLLRAAIQRRELDERVELDDAGVLQVVQKLVKQSTEAARQFRDAEREDLVQKEQAYIQVLEQYLPDKMSDSELTELIQLALAETGAQSIKDMGKVMGFLQLRVQGRADMAVISQRVRQTLG